MADKLRRAKKDVANFFEQMDRLKVFVDSNLNNASISELELRLEYLVKNFARFEESQSTIENMDVDEKEDPKSRDKAENMYFVYRPMLEVQIQKLRSLDEKQNTNIVPTCKPAFSPRLPEICLPTFSGNPLEWNEFFETFKALVHNNTGLAKQLKFQFLRNSITGAAADIIKSLEFVDKNYDESLKLLKERYDNEKHICEEHIRSLYSLKAIDKPTSAKLLNLLDNFNSHLRSLKTLGRPVATWDDLIIHLFVSKLDSDTVSKWADYAAPRRMATFQELSEFIKTHCYKLNLQPQCKSINMSNSKSSKPANNTNFRNNSLAATSSRYYCVVCKTSGHSIYRCSKFLNKTIDNRRKLVEELKLCFNCLKGDHFSSKCTDSNTCRHCKRKHHTQLHVNYPQPSTSNANIDTKVENTITTTACQSVATHNQLSTEQNSLSVSESSSYVFLATAVVKFFDKSGNSILGRALLDPGSQLNFVTENFCSKLGLQKVKTHSSVYGIGNSCVSPQFASSVKLSSRISNYTATIDVQILKKITQHQPTVKINVNQWKIPTNIELADPEFCNPHQIDVLLGADLVCNLLTNGKIKLGDDLPILQNTNLGWIVWGKTTISLNSTNQTSLHTCLTSCVDLEKQIETFWKLESNSINERHLSSEESQCEDLFKQNTTRDATGRFIVRLPFLETANTLGDSYSMAKRRFYNLETRLRKNPSLRDSYAEFMTNYLQLGHMQNVSSEKVPKTNYYLPHHCIHKPDSSTTKLRVVFDGSAKTTSGKSLNDILMVGPVVQHDLFTILVRFRAHVYVFSADITKMYRQIQVHPDDRQYQLILWRDQPNADLQTYELTTVTYGTSSAPYLATRCLKELSCITEASHPLGSQVIRNDTYVDDILTGSNSINELLQIKTQVISILQSSGMKLRKWYSNSTDILADVPIENQETLLKLDDGEFIKTLGVHWHPLMDEFQININVSTSSNITKRAIISDIARVFDPLGLAAPVITVGKLFMQQLWCLKIGWDDKLPDKLTHEWQSYRHDLTMLKKLRFPRHLFKSCCPSEIELHGFSDASEKSYGAVIYTRCNVNGNYYTTLLCAKSRVAPLQKVSLPRLELCAAQLLAQLMHRIISIVNFNISAVVLWSDSTIVLYWLRRDSSAWKTFVANRVSSIQQLSEPTSWRYVDSKNNPADVISRGLSPSLLLQSNMWLHGPRYLTQPESYWPARLPANYELDVPEQKKSACTVMQTQEQHYFFNQIDSRYHKSYWRMKRIMAYVCRFVSNCQVKGSNKSKRQYGKLSSPEILKGLNAIIRAVQGLSFHEEIKLLQRRQQITKNPLKSLSVFLDNDGILRVGGRIQQSSLPYTSKHPIVLPKNHVFTLTVIFFYHTRYLHAAPQALLAGVREMFWPIDGKRLATKIFKQCRVCFKARPKCKQQIMGNLPAKRLEQSPPFYTIGIDFCGPLYAHYKVRGKIPTKVYICVIVCFSVKAIHLELVGDMSTSAFIGALKRFVATRGLCRDIYSDNGTNFVGANSSLHELYKLFQTQSHSETMDTWCQDNEIIWHFAPPGSPHFGGIYEAAVKSAKFHLRRIVGGANLTYEELLTVIKQVEAVLNSRPITPLSSCPDDYIALTPGHFIIGRPLLALPEPNYSSDRLSLLRRWELVTGIVQHFWFRWTKEYLTSQQNRYKWQNETNNLQLNDMVIVKEENLPTNKWVLARVIEVHPGTDGKVRVATIRTKNGIFKRPITKLCPLPYITEDVDGQSRQAGENV